MTRVLESEPVFFGIHKTAFARLDSNLELTLEITLNLKFER